VQLVFILEQVLNGLLVGAYYLPIGLGLSLIFALGCIVNLATAAFTRSVLSKALVSRSARCSGCDM
jgi:branched-subunit amino acid ABC-type transport system permease component